MTRRALENGVELAKALGAKLTLMTAVEQYPGRIKGVVYKAANNPRQQAALDAAPHCLGHAQAVVASYGRQAERVTSEHSSVYQCILESAMSCGADLVVMVTHGAGALERLFVGRQTQRVLAHTAIPVLVLV